MASSGTFGIRLAQGADTFGLLNIPMLHGTMSDAISSLPFEHASDASSALGWFGDLGVADVLGDALLGFGLFKTFHNLRKSYTIDNKRAELEKSTHSLEETSAKITEMAYESTKLSDELKEASYEAFKWALIVRASRALRRDVDDGTLARFTVRASSAITAFWKNLQSASTTAMVGHGG